MKRFNTSMWNAQNEQIGGVHIRTQEPDGENLIKIKFTNGNVVEIHEEDITDCASDDESITFSYKTESGDKNEMKISTKKSDMKKKITVTDKFGVERQVMDIIDQSSSDVLINWVKENSASPIGIHVVSNKQEKPRKGNSYLLAREGFTPKNVAVFDKTVKDYEYSIWTPAWMENTPSIFVLKTEEETMFIFNYTTYSFEMMGTLLDDGIILGCIDFESVNKKEEEIKDDLSSDDEDEKMQEVLKELNITPNKKNIENLREVIDILLNEVDSLKEKQTEENLDRETEEADAFDNVDDDTDDFDVEELDFEDEDCEECDEDDDVEIDEIGNAYKTIANHMMSENIDSINFWTDENGDIHCDVKICSIYKGKKKD